MSTSGWRYEFAPGAGPLLLMLHGTGGDEHEMLALGRALVPEAAVLAPRGQVSEHGMPRYFSRSPSDPFRFPDLVGRTADLAAFLDAAVGEHGLEDRPMYAVGYSNGANVATSLLLHHPGVLAGAALWRGLLPAPAHPGLDLSGVPVLVAAGRTDTMIPPPEAERLVATLRERGAEVTERWQPGGHGLMQDDLTAVTEWLPAG